MYSYFMSSYRAHLDLHSFPTRRSSDLRFTNQLFIWRIHEAKKEDPKRQNREAPRADVCRPVRCGGTLFRRAPSLPGQEDRKSTRLNSSHLGISYAVFCLKKKFSIHILC